MATQTKVQLAPNVPVRMQIKYIDVYPNDPTKDPKGVGYGASVRLKGTVDGDDAVCYPKGKAWAVLKALAAGGVVAAAEYNDNPAEAYTIPVAVGDATLVLEHLAGEKYVNFKATAAGHSAPAVAPAASAKAPVSAGGPLPWETEQAASETAFVRGAQGAAPPAAATAPPQARPGFAELVAKYRECIDEAVRQSVQLIQAGISVDGSAVAAMAATLFIQRSQKGV